MLTTLVGLRINSQQSKIPLSVFLPLEARQSESNAGKSDAHVDYLQYWEHGAIDDVTDSIGKRPA